MGNAVKEENRCYNKKEPGGSVLARLLKIYWYSHTPMLVRKYVKTSEFIIIIQYVTKKIKRQLCITYKMIYTYFTKRYAEIMGTL